MKMLFRVLDATEDNFISLEDFYVMGKHFKENSTYKEGDIEDYTEKYSSQQYIVEFYIYCLFRFAAGAKMMGLEPGVKWSFTDFSKVHKESLQKPEYMAVMRELFNATFIMLDKDRNGFITPEEWEHAFKVFRFNDPSEAKTAFSTLDLNKDGQISYQEFMDCGLEFFCSEDNKHGSLGMLGPLPP